MSNRAWVTLATNDSYGLGALVLAHSLRRAGSVYPAVVLITPSVTEAMRDRLRAVFAEVVTVDVLDSRDAAHLALLQRPELGITFTKIHCWNLTQYEKCVFLDADILVVQNCDELFEREELSAAPDVGWPDCFNSGVFVYTPSADTFNRLIQFAQERGSFDGGDQGLLNSFFSEWARGDINKHLPFLYNVTSAAFYSYMPALKHYGQDLKIIHFIGPAKPWLQHFNWESRSVDAPDHLRQYLQLWWDLFVADVHAQLDESMSGVAGNLARVTLGTSQREAIDDLTRRQGWEAGNIDYMGVDSFDNIWAKISQTLSQSRPSPPKQSPPKESASPKITPEQVEVQTGKVAQEPISAPVEVAKEVVPAEKPVSVEKSDVKLPIEEKEPTSSPKESGKEESIIQSEPSTPKETPEPSESCSLIKDPQVTVEPAKPTDTCEPKVVPSVTKTDIIPEVSAVPVSLSTAEPVADSVPISEPIVATESVPTPALEKVNEPVTTEPIKFTESTVTEKSETAIIPDVTSETTTKIEKPIVPQKPATVENDVIKEKAPVTAVGAPVEAPVSVISEATLVVSEKDAQPAVIELPASEVPVSVETIAPVKVPSSEPKTQVEPAAKEKAKKTEGSVPKTVPPKPVADISKIQELTQTVPAEAEACPVESTPEKSSVALDISSDSPPLANTPSKEEIPVADAAKSAERRKPAGKLQLSPPVAPDPLPTPDSELEDAAALAQSIIASELRTPTVTSPKSAPSPASPPALLQHSRLSVEEPEVPTPPVGAMPQAQTSTKAKEKTTTAAQIASSVSEKPEPTTLTSPTEKSPTTEAPKKKVVKKVVKKASATGGDTPVPPPRKKEKKPKE